jgi:dolichol-phosphate mannosyltransferase
MDARYSNSFGHTQWSRENLNNSATPGEKAEPQISVIIPVYNQEKEITQLVSKIKDTLYMTFSKFEILIVDDGSTDNTLQCLREEEEKSNSLLRVISYTPNRGKGYAVREGVSQSSGNLVLFIDGDLEISPEAINAYLNEVKNYDLVIASKVHPLSTLRAPQSRKFLSRAFNLLVRASVGLRFKDTQSGMKVGRGEVLRAIFRAMLVERYAFDVEMLVVAGLFNLTIKEMPTEVNIHKRFKLKEIARMAADLVAITYRLRVNRWYYKRLIEMYSAVVKSQANEQLEMVALAKI